VKLWFFANGGADMIGCVDCSIEFARRLARLYNDDAVTTRPIDIIVDNADPVRAALRIEVEKNTDAPTK
jgi:hypothetical protein